VQVVCFNINRRPQTIIIPCVIREVLPTNPPGAEGTPFWDKIGRIEIK